MDAARGLRWPKSVSGGLYRLLPLSDDAETHGREARRGLLTGLILMAPEWMDSVPVLRGLDETTKTSLRESAIRKQISRGAVLFRPGDQCVNFPLIVAGTVRVQRVTEFGREIVLYRVSTNETCILTTASILSDDTYSAEGVAETDVTAYIVPAERFSNLMSVSASFRALVFDGYSRRIATLMSRIEEIVCTRINVRLAERLLALRGSDNRISVT